MENYENFINAIQNGTVTIGGLTVTGAGKINEKGEQIQAWNNDQ